MRDIDYLLEDECEDCKGSGIGGFAPGTLDDVLPCKWCDGSGHKIDRIKYSAYIDEEYDRAFPFSH